MANVIKSCKLPLSLFFLMGVFLEEPIHAQNKTKDVFKPTPGKSLGITRINNFEILNANPTPILCHNHQHPDHINISLLRAFRWGR